MKHRSVEQWQDIIEQQKNSGLSIATYCRENNISTTSFYHYRSKLNFGRQIKAPAAQTGFVQVKPASTIEHSSAVITLQTNLVTLKLPLTVSPQWLGQLLRELSA